MRRSKWVCRLMLVMLLIGGLLGCARPAAVVETPAISTDTATPVPSPTVNQAATQSAQQTKDVENTAVAQLAATHEVIKATNAALTEAAPALNATRTVMAGVKYTATAGVQATAQAYEDSMTGLVQALYADGKVGSTEGDYYKLDDYVRSEAQLNYFFPDSLGYEAENFVFSVDLKWASASMNANWATSGCGVLYGIQGNGKQAILTYLGLDGYTHTMMGYKDKWPEVAFKRWGKPDLPKGEAHMTVVLWDKHATVYVNDKISSEYYAPLYKPGDLGLTVISGTNKDTGTTCLMTGMTLFIFK